MSHRSDKGWTDIHLFLFIRRSTECDYDDFTSIDLIRILGIWGLTLLVKSLNVFGRLYRSISLFSAAKCFSYKPLL